MRYAKYFLALFLLSLFLYLRKASTTLEYFLINNPTEIKTIKIPENFEPVERKEGVYINVGYYALKNAQGEIVKINGKSVPDILSSKRWVETSTNKPTTNLHLIESSEEVIIRKVIHH